MAREAPEKAARGRSGEAAARGESAPQQVFKDEVYEIYYRLVETEDEYFD